MKHKETITITKELPQRVGQELPKEIADVLISLPYVERKAYAQRLVAEGWTYTAIGKPIGLTRERVRQYNSEKLNEEVQKKVEALPLPPRPIRTVELQRLMRTQIEPEVLEQLKALYEVGKQVRGKSQKHREEAEAFTKLAWEQVERGVSVYAIAKALGCTHAGLQFRFVRYGYKTSNGKSKAYDPLKNRPQKEDTNA